MLITAAIEGFGGGKQMKNICVAQIKEDLTVVSAAELGVYSRLCLLPSLPGRMEALRASSLTGKDLTRRTRGAAAAAAARGRLTGTARGTGDTLPRYSNSLKTGGDGVCEPTGHSFIAYVICRTEGKPITADGK